MLIKLHTYNGEELLLNTEHIVSIQDTGVSAKWHHHSCSIRMADGGRHEIRETIQEVSKILGEA